MFLAYCLCFCTWYLCLRWLTQNMSWNCEFEQQHAGRVLLNFFIFALNVNFSCYGLNIICFLFVYTVCVSWSWIMSISFCNIRCMFFQEMNYFSINSFVLLYFLIFCETDFLTKAVTYKKRWNSFYLVGYSIVETLSFIDHIFYGVTLSRVSRKISMCFWHYFFLMLVFVLIWPRTVLAPLTKTKPPVNL